MSDLALGVAAVAAGVVALVGFAVSWWVLLVIAAVALVVRRPELLVLALVLAVGTRAQVERSALAGERPATVSETVVVLRDPVARFGRWRFDVQRGDERDEADMSTREGAPVVGERLEVRAAVRPLEESEWAVARHLRAKLRIDSVIERHPPPPLPRAVNAVRELISEGAASLGRQRPLFLGIVFGDDREQPGAQVQRFRVAGLSHLLAVSGQNVAFVLLVAAPLLRRGPFAWRWIASMVLLGAFAEITRAEPSVLRAVAMAAVASSAQVLGRGASPIRVLSLATLGLSVLDPLLWHSVGFQLSLAATAALILVRPVIAARLAGPRVVREALAAVLAAQLATFPLLAWLGATTSIASLVANLLAVPVAGAVMVWGLTGGVLAALSAAPLGWLLHRPTALMLWWIDAVARWASSPRWPLVGATTYVIVALGTGAALSSRRWVARIGRILVAAWCVALFVPAASGRFGCGPAIVGWRRGEAVVVSVSGSAQDGPLLECLARHRVRRVDLLVLGAPGAAATRQAATVREISRVGTVLAAPGRVRGARRLQPGRWRVGTGVVEISRDGGAWSVQVG